MKIYDWHIAPNPRRLHIYLAEKGIKVELVEVGQQDLTLAPWFKQNTRTRWCRCWNWMTARKSARRWRLRVTSRKLIPNRR